MKYLGVIHYHLIQSMDERQMKEIQGVIWMKVSLV
jgi:hypothetical protein